jgi:hypothetical protein
MAAILSGSTQHRLAQLETDWSAERTRMARDAVTQLSGDVSRSLDVLRDLARRALRASPDRGDAFRQLTRSIRGAYSGDAITLYRGDSAFAWAGREHVRVDSLTDSVGVAASTFYLALYGIAISPTQRAVATRLLYALPPADRIATSLGGDVARRTDIAGFRFSPADDAAAIAGATIVRVNGRPLFAVAPTLFPEGPVQLRLLERARLIIGAMLALALAAFLIGG